MTSNTKRFQECSFIVKIWRLRYYLLIPFIAFKGWWLKAFEEEKRNWHNFKNYWVISTGIIQGKMKWYYTFEEVKKRLSPPTLFASPDEYSNNEGCIILEGKYYGKNIKKRSQNKN